MSQSKKKSLLESIANMVVGFSVSFIIQLIIYPSLGIKVNIDQNVIITSVFMLASIVRGYLIRRLFNRL